MRIRDNQQFDLLKTFRHFRHAGDGVAAVPHDEHGFEVVLLSHLLLRQRRRFEPACGRDTRRVHGCRRVEARLEPVKVGFPNSRPMPPCTFGEAVIERQCHDIEAKIGGALHVAMAAEDVGAVTEAANVAGGQQENAACSHIRRADRELGLTHRPDQRRGLLLGEHLCNAFELSAGKTGHAFGFFRRPLGDLLADLIHAVDALRDEFLVLPAILKDMPEDAVDSRDVRSRAHADIFRRVRGRARQAGIDDNEVRPLQLLAFEQVLQRHRMRLGRIAAHDHERLGIADVVVAVGHRAVAPGIGYAGDRRRMANTRLVIGIVGSPIGRELAIEIRTFV